MLYDNAEIPRALLAGYQLTGEDRYADVVAETMTFLERELTNEGGFFSTLDAQSEDPETGERGGRVLRLDARGGSGGPRRRDRRRPVL